MIVYLSLHCLDNFLQILMRLFFHYQFLDCFAFLLIWLTKLVLDVFDHTFELANLLAVCVV